MIENIYSVTVFISSPSGMKSQRKEIVSICNNWTKSSMVDPKVSLKPVGWENDAPITSGESPQDIISNELLVKSDILVGIFGIHFGSPTLNYKSGTEEEIEYFLANKRPVILYFWVNKVNPTDIKIEQLEMVNEYKRKYQHRGLYKEISTAKQLRESLFNDLTFNVRKVVDNYTNLLNGQPNSLADNLPINIAQDIKPLRIERGKSIFDISIGNLINEYLREENIMDLVYIKGLSFTENMNLWKSTNDGNREGKLHIAKDARKHAFNIKYGNYDYDKDLRSIYPNWFSPITNFLDKFYKGNLANKKIIGAGSNNGTELVQIFSKLTENNQRLEVLDISSEAIKNGRMKFRSDQVNFHVGNMEECHLKSNEYDIYLNLRAVHSSGVDLNQTVAECMRLVKPGGVAIFSVSNGYLKESNPLSTELFTVVGMLESSSNQVSRDKPYDLADKIRRKVISYGFLNSGINTGDTEIFIWAIKD